MIIFIHVRIAYNFYLIRIDNFTCSVVFSFELNSFAFRPVIVLHVNKKSSTNVCTFSGKSFALGL